MSNTKWKGYDYIYCAVVKHMQEHLGRDEAFNREAAAIHESSRARAHRIRDYVVGHMLPPEPPLDHKVEWIEIDTHLYRAVAGHMKQELGEAEMLGRMTAVAYEGRAVLVCFVRAYVLDRMLPAGSSAARKPERARRPTRRAMAARPMHPVRRADRS